MRKVILLALCSMLMVSCQKPASVLHVVSADSCDEPAVIGTIGTKEYALSVADPKSDLACQSVIGTKDVGKDFPVTVNLDRGVVRVAVGSDIAVYKVKQARDVSNSLR